MHFTKPLEIATLIKRYKRFLADIQLPDGKQTTIFCPNTGSMKNCASPGWRIWFSQANNPNRKYPYTWELVQNQSGDWIGINTHRANSLAQEAIENGVIAELNHYDFLQREVSYGEESSRIDFLLQQSEQRCYVEVKSVTLGMDNGVGLFPDAVSSRGSKHLRELMTMRQAGHRAVLLFCVQHTGIKTVQPADAIDPVYGKTLRAAVNAGVEVLAYGATISPTEISLQKNIDLIL